jgi:hypothetical protein
MSEEGQFMENGQHHTECEQQTNADTKRSEERHRNKKAYISTVEVLWTRIRMFFGLLETDPLARCTDPYPSIIKQK